MVWEYMLVSLIRYLNPVSDRLPGQTPEHWIGYHASYEFDVQLVFHKYQDAKAIKALVTDLSNYQIVLDLPEALSFDSLHLATRNNKIINNAASVSEEYA